MRPIPRPAPSAARPAPDIRGMMILTAALIEGAALFGIGVAFLVQNGIMGKLPTP